MAADKCLETASSNVGTWDSYRVHDMWDSLPQINIVYQYVRIRKLGYGFRRAILIYSLGPWCPSEMSGGGTEGVYGSTHLCITSSFHCTNVRYNLGSSRFFYRK
jgi:hypothetical protein